MAVPPSDFRKRYRDSSPSMSPSGISSMRVFAIAAGSTATGLGIGAAGFAGGAASTLASAVAANSAIATLGSSATPISIGGTAAGFVAGPLIVCVAAAAVLGTQIAAVLQYESFDANILQARLAASAPLDLSAMASTSEGRKFSSGFLISMILAGAGNQKA